MKVFLMCLLLLTVSACANKREQEAQLQKKAIASETMYGGKCAMGLCLKKDVPGDERYSVDYKGKHYIFSSPEARDNFLSKIDANIKKSDAEWAKKVNRADRTN